MREVAARAKLDEDAIAELRRRGSGRMRARRMTAEPVELSPLWLNGSSASSSGSTTPHIVSNISATSARVAAGWARSTLAITRS